MDTLPVKEETRDISVKTRRVVDAETSKVLDLIPCVIDQYKKDIEMAGRIQDYISGDNLVCCSPIMKDPRSLNDFMKRVDVTKIHLLKAVGLIAPVAANVRVQQVFNQNNTNILDPGLFAALGSFLELEDSSTNSEFVAQTDEIEAEYSEVTG